MSIETDLKPLRILYGERLIQLDVPNDAGRVFPTSTAHKTIRGTLGKPVYGYIGVPRREAGEHYQEFLARMSKIDMAKVSQAGVRFRVEDGYLVGDIFFLPTEYGRVLHRDFERDKIRFQTAGMLNLAPGGKLVTGLYLSSLHAVLK